METATLRERVHAHIEEHRLIEPDAEIVCLVSGGADSTCLWHVLGSLGYAVSALHVNHGLRDAESEADADFCARVLGAEIVHAPTQEPSEAVLRELRYSFAADRLRATGHTASDQVETILYRMVSSGTVRGMPVRRDDGVVRPLLPLWRSEIRAYCRAEGLAYRDDSSNAETKRGLIRREIVPRLRRLHPAAEQNLLAACEPHGRLPRPVERGVTELLESRVGSKRVDLGSGLTAVREYDELWLERSAVRLTGPVTWGRWRIEPRVDGLHVRTWRAGDRLAAGGAKVQDLFADARVPRSHRDTYPLVVRGGEVVVIPGIACAAGFEGAVTASPAA
ncbi:MAG: tRNA lysidine(34) synthetase TilS [Actinomycetia bacterium]|nr:tRNA lysidine(34) synthetase TilS [Actinomycetes bacterium]